jgi:hypothetical protein
MALATGSEVPAPKRVSAMVRAKSKAVAGPRLVTKLPGTDILEYDQHGPVQPTEENVSYVSWCKTFYLLA